MFIFFIVTLAVSIGMMAMMRFDTPDAVSAEKDDFNMPVVTNSAEIPVVFGTVKLESPNIINWGNFRSKRMRKKVKTGMFSSKRVTTGYKYYCTMDMALCLGTVNILKVEAGPYLVAGSEDLIAINTTSPIIIDEPRLYGQEGGENQSGLVGKLSIYRGGDPKHDYHFTSSDGYYTEDIYKEVEQGTGDTYNNLFAVQPLGDPLLFSTDSNRRPGCPGVARAIFDGWIGNTTNVRPFKFTVQGVVDNVVGGNIGIDANPAAVIYEILTNEKMGLGLTDAEIDISALQAAATKLVAEDFGISLKWSRDMEAGKLIDVICEHINATYYTDNQTGQFTLQLVRKQDNYDGIPAFTENEIIDLVSISRPDTSELVTEVKVKYISRDQDFKEAVAVANSQAAEYYAGRPLSQTQKFTGISNAKIAQLVAARRLAEYSASPATIEFRVMTAQGVNNGQLAELRYPQRGVEKMIGRITQIDHGTLEKPIKTIKMIEDIFSTVEGQFTEVPPMQWEGNENNRIPGVITEYIYIRLHQLLTDNPALILIAQAPADTDFLSIEQYSELGSEIIAEQDFYEHRFTQTAIKRGDQILTFAGQYFNATQASAADIKQGVNLAIITDGTDHEWVAFKTFSFDSGTGITTWSGVERGLIETPTREWPANTPVYLLGELNVIEPDPELTEVNPVLRVYSENMFKRSDDYAEDTVADNGAHTQPLPPEININDSYYPEDITGSEKLNVSLLPRNADVIALNQELAAAQANATFVREIYVDDILADTGTEELASFRINDLLIPLNIQTFTTINVKGWAVIDGVNSNVAEAIIYTWGDNTAIDYSVLPLLINPGAEDGLDGWYVNPDRPYVTSRGSYSGLSPRTGARMFNFGRDFSQQDNVWFEQEITDQQIINKYGKSIEQCRLDGLNKFKLTYYDSTPLSQNGYGVSSYIYQYDALDNLLDSVAINHKCPTKWWAKRTLSFAVAPGAVKFKVRFRGTTSNSYMWCAVDDVEAILESLGNENSLIENGSFEANLAAWDVVSGSIHLSTKTEVGALPKDGSRFARISGEGVPNGIMTQELDFARLGTTIEDVKAAGQSIQVSLWTTSGKYSYSTADKVRARLIEMDDQGVETETAYSEFPVQNGWVNFIHTDTLQASTVSVKVKIILVRNATWAIAAVDNIEVTLVDPV